MSTTPNSLPELLPCPFCGCEGRFENYVIEAQVMCSDCHAVIRRTHAPHEDTGIANAVAAWNTRAALASDDAEMEAWRKQAVDELRQLYIENARRKEELASPDTAGWQDIESAPELHKIIVSYVNSLGKRRTVMARKLGRFQVEDSSDLDDFGEYDEETETHYWPAGWYEVCEEEGEERIMEFTPTHWMPLPAAPQPPKEAI